MQSIVKSCVNMTKLGNYQSQQQKQNKIFNNNINNSNIPAKHYSNLNFTAKLPSVQCDSFAKQVFLELGGMTRKQQEELHRSLRDLNPQRACSKRILENISGSQRTKLTQLLTVPFEKMTEKQHEDFVKILEKAIAKKQPEQNIYLINRIPELIADI